MPRSGELFDVTIPMRPGMPQWAEEEYMATSALSSTPADVANVTLLTMTSHTGTHVDAPRHFIHGGTTIDEIPMDRWVGPCVVVDFSEKERDLTAADLEEVAIPAGTTRVVLKTRNSELWRTHPSAFYEKFIAIDPGAAQWLVDRGVRLVAIDYLSIGSVHPDGDETHRILLGNDILVVEGLDLTNVPAGPYELLCFPLKIQGADGAPARVALRAL